MPSGTGLDTFEKSFPARTFDVGIAEQHAVTFAAGLATEGLKPFAVIYSTFLQRAYDQVVHDVAIQNLPVRFGIDRAGLVGADGATHAGSFDVAYLCCLPNFVVMAAADEAELMHMTATAAAHDSGPIALRYPRGEGVGVALPERGQVLAIGKGRVVREGKEVAILSLGTRLAAAQAAAEQLAEKGISCTVADARFAKPLDTDLIRRLVRNHGMLVTIEEGSCGGFGAQVLHFVANEGLLRPGFDIRTMTLPDVFQEHDSPDKQYETAGLAAADIVRVVQAHFAAKAQDRTSICRRHCRVVHPPFTFAAITRNQTGRSRLNWRYSSSFFAAPMEICMKSMFARFATFAVMFAVVAAPNRRAPPLRSRGRDRAGFLRQPSRCDEERQGAGCAGPLQQVASGGGAGVRCRHDGQVRCRSGLGQRLARRPEGADRGLHAHDRRAIRRQFRPSTARNSSSTRPSRFAAPTTTSRPSW